MFLLYRMLKKTIYHLRETRVATGIRTIRAPIGNDYSCQLEAFFLKPRSEDFFFYYQLIKHELDNISTKIMENVTENGNLTTLNDTFCSSYLTSVHKLILLPINLFISITAFAGNVLIIIALQKVSSLHRSSKILFSCLASTDLCVGIILQPVYIAFIMSPDNSIPCYYIADLSYVLTIAFCGVSMLTSTTISVDRLLALLLGLRYRHVVTLKRVWAFVIIFWLGGIVIGLLYIYDDFISTYLACVVSLSCLTTSTFCYVKIYRTLRHHQSQVQEYFQGISNGRGIPLNVARYRKTVSSALWVQITLVICYLPFLIVTAVYYVVHVDYSPIIAFFSELTLSLVQLNSSLNPILYCWKIREVRQLAKDTIGHFFRL